MKRRQGFTLIELLMVCVVIGVLMGILLPALLKSKRQAKTRQAQSEMRTIKSAIIAYKLEKRMWPIDDPAGPEKDYASDNNVIVSKLVNNEPPLLDLSNYTVDAAGNICDPKKTPYVIRLDKDSDGLFQGGAALSEGISIWSVNYQ